MIISNVSAPSIPSSHVQPVADTPDSARGKQQFEEMVMPRPIEGEKSLKQIEKWTLIGKEIEVACSTVTTPEVTEFLSVLDDLDFANAPADSVLKSPKLPYIALEALRRGLLHPQHGPMQVATILNFWAAMQYHQTPLETRGIEKLHLLGDLPDGFLEKLSTFPRSEWMFLEVPIDCDLSNTVAGRIADDAHVTTFHPENVIPSVGIMQAYLNASYGDDAVTLKPRLYLSTLRHIYETRYSDTCDMMMPTPDPNGTSRCPEEADGSPAPWHLFSYHDFYHAILASAVGKTYRRAGLIAADTVRAYALTAPSQDQKGLRALATALVEAEHPLFRREHPAYQLLPDAERFWLSLDFRLAQCQQLEKDEHVSLDNLLLAFEAIYHTFVTEQNGPTNLNQKSFDNTVHFLAEQSGGGRRLAGVPFHQHPMAILKAHLEALSLGMEPESAAYYSHILQQVRRQK